MEFGLKIQLVKGYELVMQAAVQLVEERGFWVVKEVYERENCLLKRGEVLKKVNLSGRREANLSVGDCCVAVLLVEARQIGRCLRGLRYGIER
jgi:hypothetical protein